MKPAWWSRGAASRGYTLMELVVALAVGIPLVLAATELVAQVLGGRERLGRLERAAAVPPGPRWLTAAADGIAMEAPFAGSPESVEFATRLPGRYRWFHPVAASVHRAGHTLTLTLDGTTLPLMHCVAWHDLQYLVDDGTTRLWVRNWEVVLGPPRAMKVRTLRGDDCPEHPGLDSITVLLGGIP